MYNMATFIFLLVVNVLLTVCWAVVGSYFMTLICIVGIYASIMGIFREVDRAS